MTPDPRPLLHAGPARPLTETSTTLTSLPDCALCNFQRVVPSLPYFFQRSSPSGSEQGTSPRLSYPNGRQACRYDSRRQHPTAEKSCFLMPRKCFGKCVFGAATNHLFIFFAQEYFFFAREFFPCTKKCSQ